MTTLSAPARALADVTARARPRLAAERCLIGLLVAGATVRALACAAVWPAAITLSDAANYAVDAAAHPFADAQHPAGYPLECSPHSAR